MDCPIYLDIFPEPTRRRAGSNVSNNSAYSDVFSPPSPNRQEARDKATGHPTAPRTVYLVRGSKGLGFSICGGVGGDPVYINNVRPGGVADLDGNVHEGDVLLSVNNHSLLNASMDEALAEVRSAENPVTLRLQHMFHVSPMRPVIVLGAVKDKICEALIKQNPSKFQACAPHTTRKQRPDEVPGRDYHFISRKQMEEDIKNNKFIEAGEFQKNLYGTSIQSVQGVAAKGRHCVLDVVGNAIPRLLAAEIRPIVIFIKVDSPKQLMKLDDSLSFDQAIHILDSCKKTEQKLEKYFTTTLSDFESLKEILEGVRQVVHIESRPVICPCGKS